MATQVTVSGGPLKSYSLTRAFDRKIHRFQVTAIKNSTEHCTSSSVLQKLLNLCAFKMYTLCMILFMRDLILR